MKNLKICVWVILLVLFQTSACKYIQILGIFPDVVFVFVICFSLIEKEFLYVAIVPAICGLIIDCLTNASIGVYTIMYSYSAMACFAIGEHFFRGSLIFEIPMIFMFSVLNELLFFVLGFAIYGQSSVSGAFIRIILPVALYNIIISLIIYPLLKRTVYRNSYA